MQGDARTLCKMLEMGGDVNVATHNGWTPLIEAASEGHTECVQLLAKFGANVSLPNKGVSYLEVCLCLRFARACALFESALASLTLKMLVSMTQRLTVSDC